GHIGKPITPAQMPIGKFLVVQSQLMEDGSMEIMYMYRIFVDIITKFIRFAVDDTRLHPSACHPYAEAAWMMIPAIIVMLQLALAMVGPSKFTAPNNQGFVK